jgi:hypothetical protein
MRVIASCFTSRIDPRYYASNISYAKGFGYVRVMVSAREQARPSLAHRRRGGRRWMIHHPMSVGNGKEPSTKRWDTCFLVVCEIAHERLRLGR